MDSPGMDSPSMDSPGMDSPGMDSRFGDIFDQRNQELDGFKHSFTTMTKEDFAMVINEVGSYILQEIFIFLTHLLGNRCIGYK